MAEETVNGDDPPVYCSLYTPDNRTRTTDVVVSDLEEELLVAPSFENKSTRIAFIQKILALRCLQVAAALFIISAFYRLGDLDFWFRSDVSYTVYYWIMTWSLVYFGTIFPLFYWKDLDKRAPYNYLLLVTNTISTYFILMVIPTGYLNIRAEFVVAWGFYLVLTLTLLLYTVFILDTSQEFRTRDANLLTGGLSILMIAVTAVSDGDSISSL